MIVLSEFHSDRNPSQVHEPFHSHYTDSKSTRFIGFPLVVVSKPQVVL